MMMFSSLEMAQHLSRDSNEILKMGDIGQVSAPSERVFFVKCRPQEADIIEIVQSEKRVFIGYPPWRRGAVYDPANMTSCVIDLGRVNETCKDQVAKYYPSMKTNREFATIVQRGWIVAIPRPSEGMCWLGEVDGQFELINNPPWRSSYLNIRKQQRLEYSDEASHVGDIVQSWRLSRLINVPFARIPRWISYRLLSRNTIGEIYGFPEFGLYAHQTLKKFIDGVRDPPLEETQNQKEIERRMLTFISPSALEHLCVALLQLEYPDELWWHIGGSGDGGADGLGYSDQWESTGLLQCKWYFKGSRVSDVFASKYIGRKRILASLIHGDVVEDVEDAVFWGRERLAILVQKYARSIPISRSLRIIDK